MQANARQVEFNPSVVLARKGQVSTQSRFNMVSSLYENWGITTPAPTPHKEDPSTTVQPHPNEEKFEDE